MRRLDRLLPRGLAAGLGVLALLAVPWAMPSAQQPDPNSSRATQSDRSPRSQEPQDAPRGKPTPPPKPSPRGEPQRAKEDASRNLTPAPDSSRPRVRDENQSRTDPDDDPETESSERVGPARVNLALPSWARDAIGLHDVRLSLNAQAGFEKYRALDHPLVFVVSRHGRYASWRFCRPGGRCSASSAARKALSQCDRIGIDSPCYIFAVGSKRVWRGKVETENALGAVVHVAAGTEARGPTAAKGILYYLRGYGAFRFPPGLAYRRVPPYAQRFAEAGWDVRTIEVPYYNRPPVNLPRIAAFIRKTVAAARAQGYRRVLLAGQSRGAWEILSAGDGELKVDGAILVAPAAHGTRFLSNGRPNQNFSRGNPAFRRLVERFAVPRAVFVFFQRDPFMLASRAGIARTALADRPDIQHLVIERPGGLPGHNAGWSGHFAKAWGACLLAFFDAKPDAKPGAKQAACEPKRVKVDDPALIYSSDHLFEHGAQPVSADALRGMIEGRKLYGRPDPDYDGHWHLHKDGRVTIKLDGEWVRENPVRAFWETRGNRLCILKSPVHGTRVFCYAVFKVEEGVLALVMKSQVVRLAYLR